MKTKRSSERGASFAKGGNDRMFGKQAAGPARPARTGKVPTAAPGAKSARGGGSAPVPGRALSAKAGRTGVRGG
jgi:hypothetical protein